jgi:hypothetical protein
LSEHAKAIGVAVAVAVVVALGIGVLATSLFQGPPRVVVNTVIVSNSVTSIADFGNSLQLRLYLNASSTPTDGVLVSVFVDEYNPLGSTVNVTAMNKWVVPLNYYNGAPCWVDGFTVGFGIVEGYYTSSNATAAKFLDLVNPATTYNCPQYLGYGNAQGFLFQPNSDTAASYGCGESRCFTGQASTGVTAHSWGPVAGYWNQGGAFTGFPRGVYTVLAEDEWGNSVLAYFTITTAYSTA